MVNKHKMLGYLFKSLLLYKVVEGRRRDSVDGEIPCRVADEVWLRWVYRGSMSKAGGLRSYTFKVP